MSKESHGLFISRTCYLCLAPIPKTKGLYDSHLGILIHQGPCARYVLRASFDYSRSKRGRRIPNGDILRALRGAREIWSLEPRHHMEPGFSDERSDDGIRVKGWFNA